MSSTSATGIAVAIRIESHNHPSAVEPYQGAATGVGGIIRDIFSMGARPIAVMDPLRFGPLDDPRTRYLFEGVVSGISGYGNAVGVPTVGGEVVFDECYAGNPLVNVLCLGVLPKERLVLARAEGVGNLAVLMGSSTGRDGIGGASVLASAGFVEGSETKRPSVQVGDPFEEKKLIEACLALLDAGLAIGVQDLGAAGLSCAASETAAKTGAGMDVDVARVVEARAGHEPGRGADVREPGAHARDRHAREPRRGARALRALGDPRDRRRPGHRLRPLPRLRRLLRRDRRARREPDSAAGRRAAGGVLGPHSPSRTSRSAASATARSTTARSRRRPTSARARPPIPARELLDAVPARARDLSAELLDLLAAPNIADKSWVWRQYDHQLFLNTVAGPGGDASVLRLKETDGQRARALGRRQGPVLCARPTRRRAARGARGGAQRRVQRRPPDGAGQLPQLRQPGAPRGDVAVLRGGRRHGRRVPRARHPGGRWQRQLLQRVARRGHRPDAGRRRDRSHRPARLAAAGHRAARRATGSSCSARPAPSSAGPSGRRATACATAARRRRTSRRAAALHELVAGLVTDRMVGGIHDCSDGGVAVDAGRDGDRGRGRLPGGDRRRADVLLGVGVARRALGRARTGSTRCSAGPARRGSRRCSLGDAGGADLHADGAFTRPARRRPTDAWRERDPFDHGQPPSTWDNGGVLSPNHDPSDSVSGRDPGPRLWRLRRVRTRARRSRS